MNSSARRSELVKRIRRLVRRLLPAIDPLVNYDESAEDSIAALAVLVHAELQHFLENRCLEVADKAVNTWHQDSRPRTTVISLVAYCHSEGSSALPSQLPSNKPAVRVVVDAAKRHYSQLVHRNNGVKEDDLIKLLLPIGVREHEVTVNLAASLDWLGSRRGSAAHSSYAHREWIDPQELSAVIVRILRELRNLDRRLLELRDEYAA